MIANANLRNTSVRDVQGAAQRQSGVRSTEDRSERGARSSPAPGRRNGATRLAPRRVHKSLRPRLVCGPAGRNAQMNFTDSAFE